MIGGLLRRLLMVFWPEGAFLGVTFLVGVACGFDLGRGHSAQKELRATQTAINTANRVTTMTSAVATRHEIQREAQRQFEAHNHQETQRNVENNPAYRQCGLDADGLRLWNERNAGVDAAAGQPDPALPHLALHLGWHAAGADPQPSGDYQPVSRMPEAAERAGRVDTAEGDDQP